MNKVITINLGGVAFQLEDAGYDALRAYLETARARLDGNPDCDEILSDIERAIGEKFAALLNVHKNVVLAKEVTEVLRAMGEIEDEPDAPAGAAGAGPATGAAQSAGARPAAEGASTPKRLYRIQEGAMLAGVCNGIGAYCHIDPTFVRIIFVLITFLWGMGLLVYLVMAFVVPSAQSPEEKAAATGAPATAQEFIRRARQGYYDAMKSFPDRRARREWKRKFRQEMREWRTNFHCETAAAAEQWRHHWHTHWAAHPGAGLALPMVSLLHGALVIGWICTLISLLGTGALFGVALPAGLPVWLAVLIVMIAYGMLVWPLKTARRAFYYGGPAAGAPFALFCIIDVVIWIIVAAALFWLALHYFPQARDALYNVPHVFHDMIDSFRRGWGRGTTTTSVISWLVPPVSRVPWL